MRGSFNYHNSNGARSSIAISTLAFCICAVMLIGSGMAEDVAFVFGDGSTGIAGYTPAQIEQASIASPDLAGVPAVSSPSKNEVLAFPVTGGGNTSEGSTKEKVGDLQKAFDERTDTNNQYVLDEAALLAAKYPGDLTMDQVCSIYSYLKNGDEAKKGWSYVRDRRGPDYYRYANESLKMGDKAVCSGVGDCDDFAILMSSLIESIGGTTRIILAHNNTTVGHAYTEVYLGNLNVQNNQVEGIASWLKQKFNSDKIYTHIDTNAKDVWLNMDWGLDEKGIAHPGGPFYQGDKHIVICIRDTFVKTPLKLPEKSNKPPKLTSLTSDKPSQQDAGTAVTWTAEARDLDNDQVQYQFFLNGEPVTEWQKERTWAWATTENDTGENQIEVQVRDGKHAGPDSFDSNKAASFTITEPKPKPTVQAVSQSGSEVEVVIPDPNLEAAIREAINKPEGPIHIADLDGIKNLQLNGKSIKDISGLEHCTKLESLSLRYNQITDISPLSGLTTLKMLDLLGNQIANISPLSGLTKLETLGLGYDSGPPYPIQIADPSPLLGLTNLKKLHLFFPGVIEDSYLGTLRKLKNFDESFEEV